MGPSDRRPYLATMIDWLGTRRPLDLILLVSALLALVVAACSFGVVA